jgi:dihydroxyacetone kinase-like predicted kinase
MKARLLRTAHAAFLCAMAAGLAAGQSKNHDFAITANNTSRTWTVGNAQVASGSITQAVVDAFVQRLTQKGFKRVQTLNSDCCAIQVELVNAVKRTVTAKITLFDLDKQAVYSKTYDGEAAAQSGDKGIIQSAAAALVDQAFADPGFLKKLSGT